MRVRNLLFYFAPLLFLSVMFLGYTTGTNEISTHTITAFQFGDSVLVLMNDSLQTPGTVPRKADRDTLRKYLSMFVSKIRYISKDSGMVLPPLANYSLVIVQETSYDPGPTRGLTLAQRTAIKTWLATGVPGAKKNLMMIGGDVGYHYDRPISSLYDIEFSRGFGGFEYVVDRAAYSDTFAAVSHTSSERSYDVMTVTPPGASYWPDGCKPVNGGVIFHKYLNRGTADTVAGISKTSSNWNVISTFQDPRYFTGAGDGQGDTGFKRILKNMLGWIQANGGTSTGVEPIGSQFISDYKLSQNFPNPFNPVTRIEFSLLKPGNTSLTIYDISGKEVARIVNEHLNAGSYFVDFNASNLASATYFYRLEVNGFVNTKKMFLIK